MVGKGGPVDVEIARIADGQHGVVTSKQLFALGLSRAAVSKRARNGRLHRLHQGVYAVGFGYASRERSWMAAVLACGEGAVLSHASAAVLWELLRPISGPVHVSIPSRSGRRRKVGIQLHRCASLGGTSGAHLPTIGLQMRPASLVTVRNRIPVTTVPRTIADLRGALPPHLVRRATRQAELAGHRIQGAEAEGTRSDLESDFLCFCRRHALPRPEVNVTVGRFEVDFVWRDQGVAVETDDFRYHRGRVAFEDDRARELELRRHGFAVRRFTGQLLGEQPDLVAADLRRALADRRTE